MENSKRPVRVLAVNDYDLDYATRKVNLGIPQGNRTSELCQIEHFGEYLL